MKHFHLLILLTCSSCATWSTAPLPVEMTSLEGVVDEVMVAGWYLGVEVAPNESDSLDELEVRPGVRLTAVSKDSPAQEAGLQVGDILLSWEQTSINDAGRLETLLRQGQAPRIVTLRLERGARVFEQQVALSMRSTAPKPRTLYHVDRYLLRAGFRDEKTLQALPVIAWLAEDSPLRVAGAKRGDRILTFAGLDPGSAEELVRRVRFSLESGASFTVEVERGGEQISLEGTAWQAPRILKSFRIWPLLLWEQDPQEKKEHLMIGDLILFSVLKRERLGGEVKWTLLTFFSWGTGEALLESAMDS